VALSFAFGSDLTSGLHRGTVFQVAFAYTAVVEEGVADAAPESPASGTAAPQGVRRYTVRRLRVATVGVPRAGSAAQLLGRVHLDATLLLLAHKAAHEAAPRGVALGPGAALALQGAAVGGVGGEPGADGAADATWGPWSDARALLQDWLARLAVAAADAPPGGHGGRDRRGRGGHGSRDENADLAGGFLQAAQLREGGVDLESVLGRRLGLLAPYVHALCHAPLLASRRSKSRGKSSSSSSFTDLAAFERRAEDAFACAESLLCHQTAAEFRKACYPDLVTVEAKCEDPGLLCC
jgi:hypothetical protein